MKGKRANSSDKFDVEPLPARRKTAVLPDGSYFFEDELKGESVLDAAIITCSAWLLELFEVKRGEIFFMCGEEEIRPKTNCFGVFYAPFSIVRPCFRNAKGILRGLAAVADLPKIFSSVPAVFDTTFAETPGGISQAAEILKSGENFQPIEAFPKASLLSIKAKRLIDENYLVYPSIARAAKRLNVSHEHLSRQFKSDFRMTPSDYLRQLRMADAPLLLAKGEAIIDVSQDVGYNDLSRFYKQFRKTTNTSPGACQTLMKPKRARRI